MPLTHNRPTNPYSSLCPPALTAKNAEVSEPLAVQREEGIFAFGPHILEKALPPRKKRLLIQPPAAYPVAEKEAEAMMKRVERPPVPEKKRSHWTLFFMGAALMCALCVFSARGARTVDVTARKRELPVYSVERNDGKIAISFDAAWGGDKTEKILDILDEYTVKTTFFLVDIWTQRYPELVREIIARGHEIGNHSTTHPHMSALSRDKIRRELDTMADQLEKTAGVRPTLFRPPYGDYSNDVVLTARAAGYEAVQWSVDSLDWKNQGVQPLIDRATRQVKSGDIVLFHNDSQYIVDALPTILKSYREQGLSIVPVSALLLPGETTIDVQGRQHPAATTIPEV